MVKKKAVKIDDTVVLVRINVSSTLGSKGDKTYIDTSKVSEYVDSGLVSLIENVVEVADGGVEETAVDFSTDDGIVTGEE